MCLQIIYKCCIISGSYNSFVGNVGVQGAYGPGSAGSLGLGNYIILHILAQN